MGLWGQYTVPHEFLMNSSLQMNKAVYSVYMYIYELQHGWMENEARTQTMCGKMTHAARSWLCLMTAQVWPSFAAATSTTLNWLGPFF